MYTIYKLFTLVYLLLFLSIDFSQRRHSEQDIKKGISTEEIIFGEYLLVTLIEY